MGYRIVLSLGGVALCKHKSVLDLLILRLQRQCLTQDWAGLSIAFHSMQRNTLPEQTLDVLTVQLHASRRILKGALMVTEL